MKRRPTNQELFNTFMRVRGAMAPATVINYECAWRHFYGVIGEAPIDREAILKWNEYSPTLISSGRQPSWVNRAVGYICTFLIWLRKTQYVDIKLTEFITRFPEGPPKPVKIITEEEYKRIWEYCNHIQQYHAHLWMITLAYRTGMSKVDCAHLRWKDVHLNENSPSFIDHYRIKTRRLGDKALCQIPIIPMTDVHGWLLTLHSQRHLNYKHFDGVSDYVYQDCPGLYRDISRFGGLDKTFKHIFRQAKVEPGKTFKHLRSAFVSNLVNSGAPIPLIMKMSGHNTVQVLMKYLKPDRRALQEGLAGAFEYASATTPNPDGTIPTNVIQLPAAAGAD